MFSKIMMKTQEMKRKMIEKTMNLLCNILWNEQGGVSPLVVIVSFCLLILGIVLAASPNLRTAFTTFFTDIVSKIQSLDS